MASINPSGVFPIMLSLSLLGTHAYAVPMPGADTSNTDKKVIAEKIAWQAYHRDAFLQAQTENKFLLLDLKAVWCHWCHVMDASTYQNDKVVALIEQKFVPMKVDHDARPDLAERYRDWGWPATIILTADGREIVKRAGYISPKNMANLLQAVIDDPSPEGQSLSYPKYINTHTQLSKALKTTLMQRHLDTFDNDKGGLDIAQKFIEADSVLWDMHLAKQGDPKAKDRVILTLNNALNLIDPAFGGAYQYSTHGDWKHPHYEKIMKVQARYLRIYAWGYQQFKDLRYLKAAEQIARYLNTFLSDTNGGFYNSQDADLKQGEKAHDYFDLTEAERLKRGIPRIDKHQYAGENADAIDAFLVLYQVTHKARYLKRAETALAWVLKHRKLGLGGYRHNKQDFAGPYLADTLNMGQALLRYYQISGNPNALKQAQAAASFIAKHFAHPTAGLISATDNGTPVSPLPQIDQNISAGLFLAQLQHLKPTEATKATLDSVLRYLNSPEVALSRITEAGVLRVNEQVTLLN